MYKSVKYENCFLTIGSFNPVIVAYNNPCNLVVMTGLHLDPFQ